MKTHEPNILLYGKNPNRGQTYDLKKGRGEPDIKYFVLSSPRDSRFKVQGAVYIMESWTNSNKTFFTGLILLSGTGNVFFGDHLQESGKKSLFCLVQEGNTMQMHYFNGICPKSKEKKVEFLANHFKRLAAQA